ncbi:hypothetical protein R1flu_016722 [Riccia fluitans]|uniref:BTB domain-containing protein n=1 Tax=Riccia fluitans TaxID=41844 RepID=A0ABD1YMN7_9MARC
MAALIPMGMKIDSSVNDCWEEMRGWSRPNPGGLINELTTEELGEDPRAMVNNPQFSDIVFLCRDGVQVHALRMFLAARSVVFKEMLLREKAESKNNIIALPTITSSTFIEVLNFLYAGNSQRGDNTHTKASLTYDWKHMMDVLVASQYLLLEGLEKLIVRKLWFDLPPNNVVPQEDMLNKIAVTLSILCDYPTSVFTEGKKAKFMEVIRLHLLLFWVSHGRKESAALSKVSKEAFRYYLEKRQQPPTNERLWGWQMVEDEKLELLLAWCAIRLEVNNGCKAQNVDGVLKDFGEVKLFKISRERWISDAVNVDLNELLPLIDLTWAYRRS